MSSTILPMQRSQRSAVRTVRKRFHLEWLESRRLLSTYTVINTNDNTSSGSLRWAITSVNRDSTPDTIDFAIPGTGLQSIVLSSALGPLPNITNPVVINGMSQNGYSGTPLVEIDGANLASSDSVLSDSAGSSTIEGLAITGGPGAGIVFTTGGNNLVQSCYIGTPDGTAAQGNGVGVEIFGSAGNTIGGSTSSAGNVISANTNEGIAIGNTQATESNLIEGNHIGVDVTGSVGLGNGQDGLVLNYAAFNTITGNVISGNTSDGILVQQSDGTSTSNTISNNQIGTNAAGTSAIPNTSNGIELDGVSKTTIASNVVSGNTQNGVLLDVGTSNTLIESNMIGTNLLGTLPLSNGQDGIQSVSSSATTIGGRTHGAGNLISGNNQNGINLPSSGADNTGVIIEGNIIGLDAEGTATLANGTNGIFQNGSNGTTIGGTTSLTRNIISGNDSSGISLGTGNNSLVEGNYIGTDITGTKALANQIGLEFTNASYATIGGTVSGSGNVISGNTQSGIDCFVIGSTGELIEGNLIGVDSSGVRPLGNGNNGIRISGPTDCTIGGIVASAANIVSANGGDGLSFTVGPANGLVAEGNYIGTDRNGDNLGNQGNGVTVWSNDVTIGGTAAGAGNVIAFNQKQGIALVFSVNDNSFLSNSIYDNAGLGISLGDEGGEDTPTPNHLNEQGFTLPQPNNFQNYPVLTRAVTGNSETEVTGTLNAGANTSYLVQFFASPAADPSGCGPGELYLGSTTVTTGSNYDANVDAILTTAAPVGWQVSATATDPLGNTSEFAQDVVAQASTASADVGVQITASPSPSVYVGATLTYTVTVSNSGPDSASGVIVTDTLPQNIGLDVTATTSVPGVTPVISNGIVTAILGTMAANTSATLTITVQPTAAAVPQITDGASVSSLASDPKPSNNTATLATTVVPSADLALTLQGSPGPVFVGGAVIYVLTATNSGPSGADDVVVTDTLPTDITANITATTSISGVTPVIANGEVTADLGTLTANGSATVTITVLPDAAGVPQISDSATITSDTYDPNSNNNTPSPVTTVVQPVADLQVGITAGPSPVPAGQDVSYTITATNNGPSSATGVTVTDTIPSGVTFVSATGGVTPDDNGELTFNVGNLADHDSTTLTVVVATSGTTPSPAVDQTTISSAVYDSDASNNTATSSVPITSVSDLSITMAGTPSLLYVGKNLTYTIVAVNSGPSDDPAAVVTDTLPANVTFVSATGGAAPFNGVLTMSLGTLAANTSSDLTIVVTPTAAAAGTITNNAEITGEYNSNQQNSASVETTVNAETALTLHVSAAPASAVVGENLTYTFTATDNGPSNATGVVLTDALPADISSNVTATTSVAGVTATISNGEVTADFGDLNINASVTLTITVVPTVAAVTNSPMVNTASIANNEFDPNSRTATTSLSVNPVSILSITMSGEPNPVFVGSNLTYTIVATNSGPSTDPAVFVSDVLPSNVTFVSATGGSTPSGNLLTLGLGSLAAGASSTLTVVVTPTAGASGSITNNATITGQYNTNVQNSASLTTTVSPPIIPTITWSNPADITYGASLSGTQLDATASVPGTLTYTPAAGIVLSAGASQTLSVSFTPTNTSEYSSATATVLINVDQATPTIHWANPADITYGTALSGTQLDATASVPGTLTYTPAKGGFLDAGSGQQLTVTFTPNDSVDYAPTSATTLINVDKATPTLKLSDPGGSFDGSAMPASVTITGSGQDSSPAASLAGVTPTLTYYEGSGKSGLSLGSMAPTAAGTYTVVASFAGTSDYSAAQSAPVTFSISSSQSGPATESASPAMTTVVLTPQPVLKNKKVVSETLTAKIEPADPGANFPTGTVTFEVVTKKRKKTQTKTLGTAAVRGGVASVTVKAKLVLSKTITVIYSGDPNFQASTVTVPKLPKNGR